MKKTYIYVCILCIYGCSRIQNNDKSYIDKIFYENKVLKEECEYLNGEKQGYDKKYFPNGKLQEYSLFFKDTLLYSETYSMEKRIKVYRKMDIKLNKESFHLNDTLISIITANGPEKDGVFIFADINESPIDSISKSIESIPCYKNKGYFKTCIKKTGKLFLNIQVIIKDKPPYALTVYKELNVLKWK